jgi:hypothetical protein
MLNVFHVRLNEAVKHHGAEPGHVYRGGIFSIIDHARTDGMRRAFALMAAAAVLLVARRAMASDPAAVVAGLMDPRAECAYLKTLCRRWAHADHEMSNVVQTMGANNARLDALNRAFEADIARLEDATRRKERRPARMRELAAQHNDVVHEPDAVNDAIMQQPKRDADVGNDMATHYRAFREARDVVAAKHHGKMPACAKCPAMKELLRIHNYSDSPSEFC